MSSQYGELGPTTADICWRVCGTPANFNGFLLLASLLQRRRSTVANQTARCLAVSWASTLYVHFRGLLPRSGMFSRAKFTLRPSLARVLLYWQRYCTALKQWASAKLCGVVQEMELRNFRRQRHLYSVGRPSRWESAHTLVTV